MFYRQSRIWALTVEIALEMIHLKYGNGTISIKPVMKLKENIWWEYIINIED